MSGKVRNPIKKIFPPTSSPSPWVSPPPEMLESLVSTQYCRRAAGRVAHAIARPGSKFMLWLKAMTPLPTPGQGPWTSFPAGFTPHEAAKESGCSKMLWWGEKPLAKSILFLCKPTATLNLGHNTSLTRIAKWFVPPSFWKFFKIRWFI